MTTLIEAREAIYSAYANAGVIDSADLTFDNEAFDPPDTRSWARLSVRHTFMGQETLGPVGGRKFQRLGTAFVQIFTLSDQGLDAADSLADATVKVFEGVRLPGTTVRFLNVLARESGPYGKWYQVVVEANFEYDETR